MIYLAAANSEDAFYSQLLVAVVLAAGFGIYTLIKSHKARYGRRKKPFDNASLSNIKNRSTVLVTQLMHASAKFLGEAGSIASNIIRSQRRRREPVYDLPGAVETKEERRITQSEVPASAVKFAAKKRDLTSGMELLTMEFLVMVVDGVVRQGSLQVVQQSDAADQLDITKRRLCFDELVRRGNLWAAASPALKVYTVDEYGFYGKSIRCEAMKEMATRTESSVISESPAGTGI